MESKASESGEKTCRERERGDDGDDCENLKANVQQRHVNACRQWDQLLLHVPNAFYHHHIIYKLIQNINIFIILYSPLVWGFHTHT